MRLSLFITNLWENPRFFFSVVFTVVLSIMLHELAHGWAAIRKGDDTPIRSGHMTPNPLVHMGPFSIFLLLVVGLAFGAMPIDPTRLRGKYAEAFVAVAGPVMNLLLAALAVIGLGLWYRFGTIDPEATSQFAENTKYFLYIFAVTNLVLCWFNLFPIPPLDGSHILANFHHGYARFLADPSKQGLLLLMFVIPFGMAPLMFDWAGGIVDWSTILIAR